MPRLHWGNYPRSRSAPVAYCWGSGATTLVVWSPVLGHLGMLLWLGDPRSLDQAPVPKHGNFQLFAILVCTLCRCRETRNYKQASLILDSWPPGKIGDSLLPVTCNHIFID